MSGKADEKKTLDSSIITNPFMNEFSFGESLNHDYLRITIVYLCVRRRSSMVIMHHTCCCTRKGGSSVIKYYIYIIGYLYLKQSSSVVFTLMIHFLCRIEGGA